jgi:hypothetical protein
MRQCIGPGLATLGMLALLTGCSTSSSTRENVEEITGPHIIPIKGQLAARMPVDVQDALVQQRIQKAQQLKKELAGSDYASRMLAVEKSILRKGALNAEVPPEDIAASDTVKPIPGRWKVTDANKTQSEAERLAVARWHMLGEASDELVVLTLAAHETRRNEMDSFLAQVVTNKELNPRLIREAAQLTSTYDFPRASAALQDAVFSPDYPEGMRYFLLKGWVMGVDGNKAELPSSPTETRVGPPLLKKVISDERPVVKTLREPAENIVKALTDSQRRDRRTPGAVARGLARALRDNKSDKLAVIQEWSQPPTTLEKSKANPLGDIDPALAIPFLESAASAPDSWQILYDTGIFRAGKAAMTAKRECGLWYVSAVYVPRPPTLRSMGSVEETPLPWKEMK